MAKCSPHAGEARGAHSLTSPTHEVLIGMFLSSLSLGGFSGHKNYYATVSK